MKRQSVFSNYAGIFFITFMILSTISNLLIHLPIVQAEFVYQDAAGEETQEPPVDPQWLFATAKITIDEEEAELSLRMRVFEENAWASGLWELSFGDTLTRITTWGAAIEDGAFSSERSYFAGEEIAVKLEGEVVSPVEVKGTFSYMDNSIEFVAVPPEIEPDDVATPSSMSSIITGVLFSSGQAVPVVDAVIILDRAEDGTNAGEVTTDENGRFSLEDVELGAHTLTVEMELERAYTYCPNSTGLMFFYPDVFPGTSDVGFALTGTTKAGDSVYIVGPVTVTVELEGDTQELYIKVDCQ